ncbi:SMR domain protein [Luteimonas aestuarii]|uniref:SMR domain protein n=1 Tax=Luteimonas aestuarii TaxID=453837 RepID=A0A4R5TVB5_9GAMM|nr:Smr/MutS family protein [Luteimonas aestuarii]TDK24990.1 SMR domain protein [Luteimonas aestuarii]
MSSERDDDQDDAALFRDAIGPVRPLSPAAPPPARPRPAPAAHMAARDDAEARSEFQAMLDERGSLEAGDVLSYRRDEVPARVLRRLARGDYAVRDELDLHHARASEAEAMLRIFLPLARREGHGCIRIVHGKGRHSDAGVPMLKNLVDRVLRQRADVLAFHSAPAAQGGTGAVLVLVRPA